MRTSVIIILLIALAITKRVEILNKTYMKSNQVKIDII